MATGPGQRPVVASYWLQRKLSRTLNTIPYHKRSIILPEPLWAIPFGLCAAYASLYQERLGLTPVQIGMVSSISLSVYTLSSLLGGYLADRLGRKRALLLGDLISWTAATLVWALSRNFAMFVVAAMLNGMGGIAEISFGCLLVEDTKPEERLVIFSWLQFIDLLSGLFVPLAGVMVGIYGVVAAARGMYTMAFVSMTTMFLVRNMFLRETAVGLSRMGATRGRPVTDVFRNIPQVLGFLASDYRIFTTFLVSVIMRVRFSVMGVYLALFLTRWIGIVPSVVSLFPTVHSVMMFIVTACVIPVLGYKKARVKLSIGLIAAASGIAIMALAPSGKGQVLVPVIGMVTLGTATAIINPYLSTVWHNLLPDDRRAQVLSVTAVIRTMCTAPSGYLGGLLFAVSPPYLMFALSGLLTLGALMLWRVAQLEVRHQLGVSL